MSADMMSFSNLKEFNAWSDEISRNLDIFQERNVRIVRLIAAEYPKTDSSNCFMNYLDLYEVLAAVKDDMFVYGSSNYRNNYYKQKCKWMDSTGKSILIAECYPFRWLFLSEEDVKTELRCGHDLAQQLDAKKKQKKEVSLISKKKQLADLKAKALSKLTDEEKNALGFK